MTDTTKRIAQLNDLCRTAMGVAGKLMQTEGINALPPQVQSAIREKVETFNAFTPDNDPWRTRLRGHRPRRHPRLLENRLLCSRPLPQK